MPGCRMGEQVGRDRGIVGENLGHLECDEDGLRGVGDGSGVDHGFGDGDACVLQLERGRLLAGSNYARPLFSST